MVTRFYTALALCVFATGCVYSNARPAPPPPARPPAPPPPAATTTPSGSSSGQAQTNVPQETEKPQHDGGSATDTKDEKREVKELAVAIRGKTGSQLTGRVELTHLPNGVKVVVSADHLEPGPYWVVVHEFADCSGKDAGSVGPRFDPGDNPNRPDLGHLGNLVAKAPDGEGRLEVLIPNANLAVGGRRSLLNRSLIIRAEDDKGTQRQLDDVGKRVGCAELTIAAAKSQRDGRVVWRQ